MAERSVFRRIVAIFDRASAKKAEAEFESSLAKAGSEGGEKAGANFVRELREAFNKRKAQLQVELARGTIDQKEFRKQIDLAAREFNTGIVKGLDEARRAGNLTDREFLKISRSLKRVGDEGQRSIGQRLVGSLRNALTTVGLLFSIEGIRRFGAEAIREANAVNDATRRLAATAKITGTNLGFLQQTASQAADAFKLSAVNATDFTIEVAKLTAKAGDIERTSAAMAAFLDIGAARGLDAQQTLAAIRQSILGIDEGTDKLFQANPSVLYDRFAESIGKTGSALTDTEKAQAILNAALTDGAKVRGEYLTWLTTVQGQQFLAAQGIDKTQAAIGRALQPALVAVLPLIIKLAEATARWADGLTGVRQASEELAQLRGVPERTVEVVTQQLAAARAELEKMAAERAKLESQTRGNVARFFFGDPARLQLQLTEKAFNAQRSVVQGLESDLQALTEPLTTVSQVVTETTEKTEAAAKATRDALADEIHLLQRGQQLRILSVGQQARAQAIEAQLSAALDSEKLTLEQTVALAEKLLDIRAVTASIAAQQAIAPSPAPGVQTTVGGFGPGDVLAREAADAADIQEDHARRVQTAWTDALDAIEREVEAKTSVIGDLAAAWAHGGIAGIARFAASKVRENLAAAIEEGAKAIGALALGNPASASAHGKAAALHTAAAGAWRIAEGAAGGGGGGGGVSGSAGSFAPAEPRGNARDTEPQRTIEIHLSGSMAAMGRTPEFRRMLAREQEHIRQTYGPNTRVVVVPQ